MAKGDARPQSKGKGRRVFTAIIGAAVAATGAWLIRNFASLLTATIATALASLGVEEILSGCSPSLVLSRGLSLGVVAGSLIGKLPQVRAIWAAHSAEGVSLISIWMEMVSMGIQFAYNVVRCTPLSTYAEVPILFGQILLVALTAAWADGYLGPCVCFACLSIVVLTLAMAVQWVPLAVTLTLYAANAAFGLAVVGPQVVMNWRSHSTGQLSLAVTSMTFGGLTSRLVTTLVEVEDVAVRLTVCINWALTAVLMLQFWLYRPEYMTQEPMDDDGPIPPETPFERLTTAISTVSIVSMVTVAAKVGSSRCITDLLGDQLEDRLPSVQTLPAFTMVRSVSSFSSLGRFRRMDSF